jgi:hypothetical protein
MTAGEFAFCSLCLGDSVVFLAFLKENRRYTETQSDTEKKSKR